MNAVYVTAVVAPALDKREDVGDTVPHRIGSKKLSKQTSATCSEAIYVGDSSSVRLLGLYRVGVVISVYIPVPLNFIDYLLL